MTLIKVAANDPSYCSKFSFHGRNMKNEDVRAKKPQFLPFFRKMAKNLRFYAIALSFFIFCPWNENLEQKLGSFAATFINVIFSSDEFFSRLLLYIVQISFANMTAIFAQNQLVFVFWGIQPHMNWEITRHLHQHEKN